MRHKRLLLALQVSSPPILWRDKVGGFVPDDLNAIPLTPLLQTAADQIIHHLGQMNHLELAGQLACKLVEHVTAMCLPTRKLDNISLESSRQQTINVVRASLLEQGLPASVMLKWPLGVTTV